MGISLKNVSYIYQAGTPFEGRALFDMTTTIKDGSYTAFIGHTGSGKSTIMQLLNGLYLPTSGQVHVDDTIITSQSKNKDIKPIRKKVGLVFQFPESQLFAETVLEDVAFGPQNFGVSKEEAEQRAIESLKLVGLPEEFHGQNPFDLSGGQMRRVAIAGILAMQPDILVLDEPTAGLDPRERIRFRNLLVELSRNRIVIFSTHIIEDIASSCNQVGVINKGILKYHGTPSDMANIAKDVTWTFEVPVRDFAKLPSDMLIVHHIRQGDMIKVRCLSEHKPTETAEKILPALEDSYLWLLRSVKIENKEQIITQ